MNRLVICWCLFWSIVCVIAALYHAYRGVFDNAVTDLCLGAVIAFMGLVYCRDLKREKEDK